VDGGLRRAQLRRSWAQYAQTRDSYRATVLAACQEVEDGLDNYLSVSVAQVQALVAQLSEVQIRVRQLQAAVSLIRALGGGWTTQQLPTEKKTLQFTESDYGVRR
jgi:outer membrane protein, multidrug efflux system